MRPLGASAVRLAATVLLSIPAANAHPAVGARPPANARAGSLRQYTSRGHVLGFDSSGYNVSNGTYGLRVNFEHAAPVEPADVDPAAPASDDRNAAPLGHVTYAGLWNGITVAYDAPTNGIGRSTWTVEA